MCVDALELGGSSMVDKLASVVISTSNYGRFVTDAMESILAQTYRDFEIIVVDDGSSDDTQTKLEAYLDRITYTRQQNQGCSAARNAGIKAAKAIGSHLWMQMTFGTHASWKSRWHTWPAILMCRWSHRIIRKVFTVAGWRFPFAMLVMMMLRFGMTLGWSFLLVPFLTLGLVIAALGVGTLLSALTVAYRDLRYALPFLVQFWMFATP
jgi:glycosyltransferase involved in cell wall biosynthesis